MTRFALFSSLGVVAALAAPAMADEAVFVENCLSPEWIPAEVCNCMYPGLVEAFSPEQADRVGEIYAANLSPPEFTATLSSGSASDQELLSRWVEVENVYGACGGN